MKSIYLLRYEDGSIKCGIAGHFRQRMRSHANGDPVEHLYWSVRRYEDANRRELRLIKELSGTATSKIGNERFYGLEWQAALEACKKACDYPPEAKEMDWL